MMRPVVFTLAVLLLLIQYPLWIGKGGWLRVSELSRQVEAVQLKNAELKNRNNKLLSEIRNLKEGTDAIEERARYELGMIKENEIFVQLLPKNLAPGKKQIAVAATE